MRNSRLFLTTTNNFNKFETLFYIPSNWSVVIFQNQKQISYLYMYSNSYYFYLPIPYYTNKLYYDKNVKTLLTNFIFKTNNHGIFWKNLNRVFYTFTAFCFKKLKFKGKGYYIFKNWRNTIALQFGYSHKMYIYSYFLSVKFISKTVVLLFGLSQINLSFVSFQLFNTRSYNIFTSKGIRFAKQIIYKKTGKISTYR